jgi:HK97 family phage major capsid protein
MKSIQALREQRAAKAQELHTLVSKESAWNAEVDQPIYDAGIAEIDNLDVQILRIQEVNNRLASTALNNGVIEAAERIGQDKKSDGAKMFAKWLRGGDQALTAEDWASIRNTMSTSGTASEGGYTVATEVATSVLDALKAFGGMRAVSYVLRTAQGNAMNFPTSDGTSEVGEIVAENAQASAADPSFGVKSLPVYKYSSKVVAVPIELLQDSSVDIEAFIRARLVTRLGRITNTHFTVGTGSGQPTGMVTAAGAGKVGTTRPDAQRHL